MTFPRRWSFGLRTLLLGVALLTALAWGWYRNQLQWMEDRREYLRVGLATDRTEFIWRMRKTYNSSTEPFTPGIAPWQLRIFGEQGYRHISVRSLDSRETAQRLFPEAEIWDARRLRNN